MQNHQFVPPTVKKHQSEKFVNVGQQQVKRSYAQVLKNKGGKFKKGDKEIKKNLGADQFEYAHLQFEFGKYSGATK